MSQGKFSPPTSLLGKMLDNAYDMLSKLNQVTEEDKKEGKQVVKYVNKTSYEKSYIYPFSVDEEGTHLFPDQANPVSTQTKRKSTNNVTTTKKKTKGDVESTIEKEFKFIKTQVNGVEGVFPHLKFTHQQSPFKVDCLQQFTLDKYKKSSLVKNEQEIDEEYEQYKKRHQKFLVDRKWKEKTVRVYIFLNCQSSYFAVAYELYEGNTKMGSEIYGKRLHWPWNVESLLSSTLFNEDKGFIYQSQDMTNKTRSCLESLIQFFKCKNDDDLQLTDDGILKWGEEEINFAELGFVQ